MPWVVTRTAQHPAGAQVLYLAPNRGGTPPAWVADLKRAYVYRSLRNAEAAAARRGGKVTPR